MVIWDPYFISPKQNKETKGRVSTKFALRHELEPSACLLGRSVFSTTAMVTLVNHVSVERACRLGHACKTLETHHPLPIVTHLFLRNRETHYLICSPLICKNKILNKAFRLLSKSPPPNAVPWTYSFKTIVSHQVLSCTSVAVVMLK